MWTYFGGGDPVAIVKKVWKSLVSLHLKDFRKGAPQDMNWTDPGLQNDVPFRNWP